MQISNHGEKLFYEKMLSDGKHLIYQPYLREHKLRPDFYCIEDETYYEVIATRQAYHFKKDKISKAIENGVKIKIVKPDGSDYFSKKKKNINFYGNKDLNIRDFPKDLAKELKIVAAERGITLRAMVIEILYQEYGTEDIEEDRLKESK